MMELPRITKDFKKKKKTDWLIAMFFLRVKFDRKLKLYFFKYTVYYIYDMYMLRL